MMNLKNREKNINEKVFSKHLLKPVQLNKDLPAIQNVDSNKTTFRPSLNDGMLNIRNCKDTLST